MTDHIVKTYDEELDRISNSIVHLGGFIEEQLSKAIASLVNRDSQLADSVVNDDKKADEIEEDINNQVIRILALRQPMAVDLRLITAALKISSDLERIGDHAANVAKRAHALSQYEPIRPVSAVSRMAQIVQKMIKDVLDAFLERDAERAMEVWRRDEEVDEMYNSLLRELVTYMMEDPRNITPCTNLLFVAKNIERVGDHATNMAETINFLVYGKTVKENRPKGETDAIELTDMPNSQTKD
ncbi:MAG: phosphate transport system regulatory protein PhoU [Rhodospirillaceae bacterium]|nr:phosphate transport system regulatory protein PhoU [Rhodospirillaceae bacterium]